MLDWAFEGILENLYKYHLKRRISSQEIRWHDLFDKWLDQKSDILELREAILDLYSPNYEISDREWHAWKAFVQNAGCTNITPFKKEESKVSNHAKKKILIYYLTDKQYIIFIIDYCFLFYFF